MNNTNLIFVHGFCHMKFGMLNKEQFKTVDCAYWVQLFMLSTSVWSNYWNSIGTFQDNNVKLVLVMAVGHDSSFLPYHQPLCEERMRQSLLDCILVGGQL